MVAGYTGKYPHKRVKTQVGEPGFWMGKQFGVSKEFSFTDFFAIKFTINVNTILHHAVVHVDEGDLYYRVFASATDAIETAAFPDPVFVQPLNIMSEAPSYARQNLAFSGGNIDDTDLEAYPTARIRTSGATGQRTTQVGNVSRIRGFGTGFAYIYMTHLDGTGTVSGVVDLEFEEKDWVES